MRASRTGRGPAKGRVGGGPARRRGIDGHVIGCDPFPCMPNPTSAGYGQSRSAKCSGRSGLRPASGTSFRLQGLSSEPSEARAGWRPKVNKSPAPPHRLTPFLFVLCSAPSKPQPRAGNTGAPGHVPISNRTHRRSCAAGLNPGFANPRAVRTANRPLPHFLSTSPGDRHGIFFQNDPPT